MVNFSDSLNITQISFKINPGRSAAKMGWGNAPTRFFTAQTDFDKAVRRNRFAQEAACGCPAR